MSKSTHTDCTVYPPTVLISARINRAHNKAEAAILEAERLIAEWEHTLKEFSWLLAYEMGAHL